VRRFGWSDVSLEDAEAQAQARAQEAFERIAAGESGLARREPKVAYNGAEGVPIREEVVARHGSSVITRNVYGSLCLNTPNVFFADLDFDPLSHGQAACLTTLVAVTVGVGFGVLGRSPMLALGVVAGALAFGTIVGWIMIRVYDLLTGGPEPRARRRIERFLQSNPDWHLRLYRTPAGFRLLAMHRTFDPSDVETLDAFRRLGADPLYARMCVNQRCFRARVSPKPWRVGFDRHFPRGWPPREAAIAERERWIADYEAAAAGFAACRFLEAMGGPTVHPEARAVQILHDELSDATREADLA
jgi:hypothetical protein